MDGNSPNLVTLVSTEIVANCVLEKMHSGAGLV
jgi:hypothetical protein